MIRGHISDPRDELITTSDNSHFYIGEDITAAKCFKENFDPKKYKKFKHYLNDYGHCIYFNYENRLIDFKGNDFDIDLVAEFINVLPDQPENIVLKDEFISTDNCVNFIELAKKKGINCLNINNQLHIYKNESGNYVLGYTYIEEYPYHVKVVDYKIIKALLSFRFVNVYHIDDPENKLNEEFIDAFFFNVYKALCEITGQYYYIFRLNFHDNNGNNLDLLMNREPKRFLLIIALLHSHKLNSTSPLKRLPIKIFKDVLLMLSEIAPIIDKEKCNTEEEMNKKRIIYLNKKNQ